MYGQATTSFSIRLPVSPMIMKQGNKLKTAKIFNNVLIFYYIKLQKSVSVCLSVCLYPPPLFDTTVGPQPNLAHIFG